MFLSLKGDTYQSSAGWRLVHGERKRTVVVTGAHAQPVALRVEGDERRNHKVKLISRDERLSANSGFKDAVPVGLRVTGRFNRCEGERRVRRCRQHREENQFAAGKRRIDASRHARLAVKGAVQGDAAGVAKRRHPDELLVDRLLGAVPLGSGNSTPGLAHLLAKLLAVAVVHGLGRGGGEQREERTGATASAVRAIALDPEQQVGSVVRSEGYPLSRVCTKAETGQDPDTKI